MKKIICYHGTTSERCEEVLKSKVLKKTNAERCRYKGTTPGFVYVTKMLCDAIDFSTRPEEGKGKDHLTFCVFKIIIDENELLPDNDEATWTSTISPDGYKECYRVERDLLINKDIIALLKKRINTNRELGTYMQECQINPEIAEQEKWILF